MPLSNPDQFEATLAMFLTAALDAWTDDESDLRSEAEVILGVIRNPLNRHLVHALMDEAVTPGPFQMSMSSVSLTT